MIDWSRVQREDFDGGQVSAVGSRASALELLGSWELIWVLL